MNQPQHPALKLIARWQQESPEYDEAVMAALDDRQQTDPLTPERKAELLDGGIPCSAYPECQRFASAFDASETPWCAEHHHLSDQQAAAMVLSAYVRWGGEARASRGEPPDAGSRASPHPVRVRARPR